LVSASTAGGANDHIWLRDVADNFPIGVINAGAGDVFLTTTVGSIIDNANDALLDITGGGLFMSTISSGGIGITNGNLETQLVRVEATAGSQGVFLANTGNLIIGGVNAATTGVSATGGDITISSTG